MTSPPVFHGSFTIEHTFAAPVARVFGAWTDIETKALWFIGPPDKWKPVKRELDFRVGGTEILQGVFGGSHATLFTARYHAIIPNERLVYVYDMHGGDKHLSVSLATVEFTPTTGGGTRMTFTEQAAFLDGEDGLKSRETGTAAHFDRLALSLDAPREIFSSRVFDAPRDLVFQAFADPVQLAKWWGPKGFTNTIHQFDFRPGGAWRFVMHGPDGTDYQNTSEFVDVAQPERIVFQHLDPIHRFRMAMSFLEVGRRTQLTWRMQFESKEEAEKVQGFVAEANEQNFDRLEAHLTTTMKTR